MPIVNDQHASDVLAELINEGQGGYSVAINAEKISRFKIDSDLRQTINNAKFVYPDGAGAVLGLRWLYGKKTSKVNFPVVSLTAANTHGWRLFLLGASEKTNTKVAKIVAERFPNINLVGRQNGYEPMGDFKFIGEAKPQLTLIAMGSPKQERIARDIIQLHPTTFCVGCGGAFDILAGKLKRAPELLVNNYLEWLYRLILQPFRWKRQLVLPVFLVKLIAAVFRKNILRIGSESEQKTGR